MADKSKIEWTDATWNPIRGCSRVSEGCRNCYAERIAARFSGPGQPYEGLARRSPKGEGGWTGEVRFIPELLEQPLHWKRPRKIFVNSMSDLFHEKVETEWINQIVAAMLVCPQHTFQILTKRPARMKEYFCSAGRAAIEPHMQRLRSGICRLDWPWRNIWLGVSVEDQKTADERIPLLLQTPAAVRWVSYEPALGSVNLNRVPHFEMRAAQLVRAKFRQSGKPFFERPIHIDHPLAGQIFVWDSPEHPKLDWIVAGGESGPSARPAHPDWFRSVRDQCQAASVPFFFKQWGEWRAARDEQDRLSTKQQLVQLVGQSWMIRHGKRGAGRLLDGREWNEFPDAKE